MKSKYYMMIVIIFSLFFFTEYTYKCDWGRCHYNFMYNIENPEDNFLIIRSMPIDTIYDYGCSYKEDDVYIIDNTIMSKGTCKKKYDGEYIVSSSYYTSKKKDIRRNILISEITRRSLLFKANK